MNQSKISNSEWLDYIFNQLEDSIKNETYFELGHENAKRLLDEINRLKNTQSAASILGSIKTDKKAKSSAENGKKGGRPKKT